MVLKLICLNLKNRGKDEILKGTYNGENYEIDKNRDLLKSTKSNWTMVGLFVKILCYSENLNKLEKMGFSTTADLSVDDHINMLKSNITFIQNQNNSKTVN